MMKTRVHNQKSTTSARRSCLPVCVVGVLLVSLAAGLAPGAKATEISLTDEPVAPMADYNIRLFDNLRLSFTGSFETMYDDNVNTDASNEEESFVLIPRLSMAADWPITPRIHLGTGISLGYQYYFNDDIDDGVTVGFDDDIATSFNVDFFLGHGVLRFAERFSREISVLQVNTDNDYALSRNHASLIYKVALNPYMDMKVKGTRRDTWNNKDQYEYQENTTYSLDGVVLYQTNPQLQLGPYVRWDSTDYDLSANNDRDTYSAGASLVYLLENGVRVTGSLGYEVMDVDQGGLGGSAEEDGFVGDIGCSFRTSPYVSHYLGFRYDRDQDLLQTRVNYSEEAQYTYAAAWDVHQDFTINGDVTFLQIEDVGTAGEEADIWQIGLGTAYQLNPSSTLSLNYDWRDRDSDLSNESYKRNQYSVKLTHRF